jgi:hypothetical protein
VVADLMAGLQDLTHPLRIPLADAPRDEERLPQAVAGEQVEDQRHGDLGAVRALGEDPGPLGVGRVVADPDLLRIEVEREGDRAPRAAGPFRHGARV